MADDVKDQSLDTSDDNRDAQDNDGILKGDEKDLHRIASWLGRVDKSDKETKQTLVEVSETLVAIKERLDEKPNQSPQNYSVKDGGDPLAEIGDNIQTALLSGGKEAAIGMENTVNLILEARDQKHQTELQKAHNVLKGFSNQSFFKDIEDSVRAATKQYVLEGMRADSAAKLAFAEKRADYFGGMLATVSKTNPEALETLKGGKKEEKKEAKSMLPANLKAAADRDIKAGVFKDEADFIANMSPQLRQAHGL
jgi:hypothetical protein